MDDDIINRIIEGEPDARVPDSDTRSESNEDDYLTDFLLETKEHLEAIEINILTLKEKNDNREIIDGIFRDFHTIKGLAGFVSQGLIQKIAHQTESALDTCRKGEQNVTDSLINLILISTDYIKQICETLDLNADKGFVSEVTTHLKRFDNLDKTEDFQFKKNSFHEGYSESTNLKLESIIDNIIEADTDYKKTDTNIVSKKREDSAFVRIPIQKIDTLVDMIGELIITHSQFEQAAVRLLDENDKLGSSFYRVNSLTKEIHNLSMSLRMVSLKSVFLRIKRIGNDTVEALNKKTAIFLYGEETEIDRSVVEKLVDPMVHLIKNSIYHGIEPESDRVKNGKPAVGKVEIRAYNKKGNVYIEVSDDGIGIDTKKVLQKAIEKNLVNPFLDYTDEEILNFVFLPGLSTVNKADDISGRGVGLDVVKTQITKMGGNVEIKNSPGRGTTFIMKLPINIFVINGLIVSIADSNYIIPTLSVQSVVKPRPEDWVSVKGNDKLVKLGEKIIPVVDIKNLLSIESFDKADCILVLLETRGKIKALPVSGIIEKRDIVVKPLGVDFDSVTYAFGASILGNGKVTIILDIENIFKREGG